MKYTDTTNKNGLLQDCEFWTGLGDAGISGNATLKAQFTGFLNRWYDKVVTMILASQDDWQFDDLNNTDYPVATTDLVANQQDYGFPSGLLQIRRVEVSYDQGVTWYKAEPLDVQMRSKPSDATSVNNDFSTSKPYYDVEYGALKLYPIPTAAGTACLKIWFTRNVTEFTTSDTTKEPGFDRPFHRMISIGASLDWAVAHNLPKQNTLVELMKDYEARLKQFYSAKDQDIKYLLKPADVSYD